VGDSFPSGRFFLWRFWFNLAIKSDNFAVMFIRSLCTRVQI